VPTLLRDPGFSDQTVALIEKHRQQLLEAVERAGGDFQAPTVLAASQLLDQAILLAYQGPTLSDVVGEGQARSVGEGDMRRSWVLVSGPQIGANRFASRKCLLPYGDKG
jgi:hypothetical protein